MTSLQESYIGCKVIYGNLEYAEIYKVARVWQDDGGEEDFYLVLNDMNNNFFGEIHIQNYLDGYTIEIDYEIFAVIWLDENNNIDKDYFKLVKSIQDINNLDTEEKEFVEYTNEVYEKAVK